ncbi:MAG: tetratricopeptide repeat protein [Promethearchaeota archaeon]
MSEEKPRELIYVEELINEGKHDKALQLIDEFENNKDNSEYELLLCLLLKSKLFRQHGLDKNVIKYTKQVYKKSLGIGKFLLAVDALNLMTTSLITLKQLDEAIVIIEQAENLLKTLTNELPRIYKQREATIFFNRGFLNDTKHDLDLAIEYYERSIKLREEIGKKDQLSLSLSLLAFIFGFFKKEPNHGLKLAKRALALAKQSRRKFAIAFALMVMGSIYGYKGEIDIAIKLFEQSIAISKEIKSKRLLSVSYNNFSYLLRMKGDLNNALECIKKALAISTEIEFLPGIVSNHDFLIQILIEMGDLERAQQYLVRWKELNKILKDKKTELVIKYDKALILKNTPGIQNRAKAEDILKKILDDKDSDVEILLGVLINLCDLLLIELRVTNDSSVLREIEDIIAKLLNIAEKTHSYWILGETYLFQAKLALISLDFYKARMLLTNGQKIAEKHGLTLLARKISIEHDLLIKNLMIWENLKDSKTSISERMELARLNEQIRSMINKKKVVELPEISNEESVVLLIISEGGKPVFSHSFQDEWSFQDHLFGSFLTAINSFCDELFSKGLERAIFGEYTLLMKSVSPFLVCYLFVGQSYYAEQRITYFIENIQRNKELWEKIAKYYKSSQTAQLKDLPSLEPLITNLFINKNIQFEEKELLIQ